MAVLLTNPYVAEVLNLTKIRYDEQTRIDKELKS